MALYRGDEGGPNYHAAMAAPTDDPRPVRRARLPRLRSGGVWTVALCVLLGAVTTVGVAWGVVWLARPTSDTVYFGPDYMGRATPDWIRSDSLEWPRAWGCDWPAADMQIRSTGAFRRGAATYRGYTHIAVVECAGAPLPAVCKDHSRWVAAAWHVAQRDVVGIGVLACQAPLPRPPHRHTLLGRALARGDRGPPRVASSPPPQARAVRAVRVRACGAWAVSGVWGSGAVGSRHG